MTGRRKPAWILLAVVAGIVVGPVLWYAAEALVPETEALVGRGAAAFAAVVVLAGLVRVIVRESAGASFMLAITAAFAISLLWDDANRGGTDGFANVHWAFIVIFYLLLLGAISYIDDKLDRAGRQGS